MENNKKTVDNENHTTEKESKKVICWSCLDYAEQITEKTALEIEAAIKKITKTITFTLEKLSSENKSKLESIKDNLEKTRGSIKNITEMAFSEYKTIAETIKGINIVSDKIAAFADNLESIYQDLMALSDMPQDELSIIKKQFEIVQMAPKSIKEIISELTAKSKNKAFPDKPDNFKGEEEIYFCDECYRYSSLISQHSPKKLKFKCKVCKKLFYIEDGYLSAEKSFYCKTCINKKEYLLTLYNINYKQIFEYDSCKHFVYRHFVFSNKTTNDTKDTKHAKTTKMKNELKKLKKELRDEGKIRTNRDFENFVISSSKDSIKNIGYYEKDNYFYKILEVRENLRNFYGDKRDFLKKIFDGFFVSECINIPKSFRFRFNIRERDLYLMLFDKYYYCEDNIVIDKMLEQSSNTKRPYGYFKELYDNFYVEDILTNSDYCDEMSYILKSTIDLVLIWFKRGIKNGGPINNEEEFLKFKFNLYFRTDYFYIINKFEPNCIDEKIILNTTIFNNRHLHSIYYHNMSKKRKKRHL